MHYACIHCSTISTFSSYEGFIYPCLGYRILSIVKNGLVLWSQMESGANGDFVTIEKRIN